MKKESIAQVSTFPGWIIGVSCSEAQVYRCWIITPDLQVFSDGEFYETSSAAMASGRYFVERNTGRF
jgi:hypothetical protein